MSDLLDGLPGEGFIRQGLVDYRNQEVTVFSCLVAVVAPCLARAGLLPDRQPPFQTLEVELTMYRLLRAEEGNAYERYNSLLRLLISFKRVLSRASKNATPAAQRAEKRLRELAQKHLVHARLWLFGSRARGDHGRRSDFDLAVEPLNGFTPKELRRFRDLVDEDTKIIYSVDIINLAEINSVFAAKVKQEGQLWKN